MSTAEFVLPSAGLTTSVTPYTSGDVLGSEITVANFFPGGAGSRVRILGASVSDASAVIAAHDLFLFNAASTPAADNAANSWSDAIALTFLGAITFATADVQASALNNLGAWHPATPLVVAGASTSLFVVPVTRSANAVFAGGATSLQWRVLAEYV